MDMDRRQDIRIPLVLPLECHDVVGSANHGPNQAMTSLDLSRVGMALTSPMPLDVGKTFHFFLSLEPDHRTKKFSGQVRWCAGPSQKARIGIRFPKPLDISIPLSLTTEAVRSLQHQMKAQNHLLEQMVRALEDDLPGQLVLLDSDLSITDVRGKQARDKKAKRKVARFRGKDLREATELAETDVNGKKLWHVLEMCSHTGQEFTTKRCRYQGRSGGTPDLFEPGIFRARISPIRDLEDKVCSVLMSVKTEDPLGLLDHHKDKGRGNKEHLAKILKAAATGFLLRNVLTQSWNPLTHLLAELDLVEKKLEQQGNRSQPDKDNGTALKVMGIEKARQSIGSVFEKLGHLLNEDRVCQWQDANPLGVNECLSQAIKTAKMYQHMADSTIRPKTESGLPPTETNSQELTTVFLILLLFSKGCLSNVSDKQITCETSKKEYRVSASISHNGFIQQHSLNILLDNNPLESFFLNGGSFNMMDTLLYYANFLLKKNSIRMRLTNIPGRFDLSLIIPTAIR